MKAHPYIRIAFLFSLISFSLPIIAQNVGIGTTSPEFKLSVDVDGGILAKGSFGSGTALTTTGTGARMIWYPKKAAFRVGAVDGNYWDDVNIGPGTFASGFDSKANGGFSTAIGYFATSGGNYSLALGKYVTASGEASSAFGNYVSTNGFGGAFAIGDGSTLTILNASSPDQFTTRFAGGYRLFSDTTTTLAKGLFFINGNLGLGLTPAFKLDVNGNIRTGQITSTVPIGTAPFVVSSSTLVPNLHAATADFATNASSATTANTAITATTATLAINFSGPLTGDINGTQGATAIGSNKVFTYHIMDGTIQDADISSNAAIADGKLGTIATPGKVSNSATSATFTNTPNTIVMRDANGTFLAGNIYGALIGNASTATSATSLTGSLSGDVTGTQSATVLSKLRGFNVAATGPTNNQVLTYNGTLNQWEPKTPTLISGTVTGSGTASRLAFWDAGSSISSNSNLNWDNTNSFLGIGTSTPEFRLSLSVDGGIMAKGGYGTGAALTTTGAGTRMFWYPKRAAFRVGAVNSNKWDDANIGENSFASGLETKASGLATTALGGATTASASFATAIGNGSTASGDYSVACGNLSTASGEGSFVAGKNTIASGDWSTALGHTAHATTYYATATGYNTTAGGYASFAGGDHATANGSTSLSFGGYTTTNGTYSTALGWNTTAGGTASTAIGAYVSTNGLEGCFILGDNATNTVMNSSVVNQFSARFNGGYRLYSSWTQVTGVLLAAGGGSWTSVSDRNAKENFRQIDAEDILVKVGSLPLSNWNYKTQTKDTRHIGPMAQDFYAAFHLDGDSDVTINTLDIDGINMAAIQGLKVRTDELKKAVDELEGLKAEVNKMKNEMEELKEMMMKK